MYELNQVGDKTYYIESPAKIGIYKLSETEVCLIDSGNDKDAGRKVQGIMAEQGWSLKFILNTHSNADHVGGNAVLQQRLNVPAYTSGIEACFNLFPILESSFLYGGYPVKELRNKFLMAQPSEADDLNIFSLPQGLEILPLEGHYFGMFGVKTDDGVWFLADCMMGENILQKYHASFIYDVAAYLATLDKVEALEGKWFIPAHAAACQDIKPLVAANRQKVLEICEKLLEWCREPMMFEEVLKKTFDYFQLNMDWNQYVLVGSTIRSYLAYLHEDGKIETTFVNNHLLWHTT
ncbi:MAG: MBL fold metallo-hydrolase [Firmicutes bacterium HGW-Firmicutes-18]|nr:MAG: MBL fold metallo-hydrolase [Firmicutes bacterium HGW-Firmicutes-18]